MRVELTVNGEAHTVAVEPRTSLLDCLRDELLLTDNPAPTRADIVDAISANICRCTGYAQIVEAIALAAERMRSLNRPASSP